MNTYTIALGANTIATINDTERAYEIYKKTCELCDLLGKDVCLVWTDNAEVVAYYDPEENKKVEKGVDKSTPM